MAQKKLVDSVEALLDNKLLAVLNTSDIDHDIHDPARRLKRDDSPSLHRIWAAARCHKHKSDPQQRGDVGITETHHTCIDRASVFFFFLTAGVPAALDGVRNPLRVCESA